MKRRLLLPTVFLHGSILLGTSAQAVAMPVAANEERTGLRQTVNKPQTILRLKEFDRPLTRAVWLLAKPTVSTAISQSLQLDEQTPSGNEAEEDEAEEEIVVEGKKAPANTAPTYTITGEEIDKQGATSVTDVLQSLPGFAINDAGFGADIHTGFYYRGTTTNQNTFLLNGRPTGSNVNTYHGATDLNTFLTGGIDRIELSSGTASTLYGSEAFGGVVNILTKEEIAPIKLSALAQGGSYGQQNYRAGVAGTLNALSYAIGYERFQADNDYPVPRGAANRGPDGRLFNGDTKFDNYFGRLTYRVDSRHTLRLDAYANTSRKGLLYFGFPLQRDRLEHDGLNIGLSWNALIGGSDDSILTATIGYNRDNFNTFGPTQSVFFRRGTLESQGLTARVEHNWQILTFYNLRYGLDLRSEFFEGETLSTVPSLTRFNAAEKRDRTNTALFVLNTFKILANVQLELGLRQNFNTEYDSSTNPSVGTRWDITPNIALRGSWVSVRRNPGLDQLYLFDTVHNWLPNPDLKPETGSAWTAGIDFKVTSGLSAQLTYFGNRLENRLSVVGGRWQNIGLVNTNGFEAGVRWELTPQLSALFNYTYTDARIESGVEQGLQLSTIPFSVAQIGIGYDWNGWQLNFYANYNSGSRRALFAETGVDTRSFSSSWLNLDLNARIPIVQNVAFLVYLENLADVSYERVNRIYQPGLTFRVGLSAAF
ncbi:TonB-dependent receptor [Phormidium sp. FACHB-592]|uniref:TonB-dependent receptor n=1 Tax=Stenomitos frigidus AS-A4 TaxID=2933935 RepID=A0ABV0KPH0_9CYAN|nr:TonB-dependent receptor [Phormidium sp. FACHB-592]MBD2072624.1 TonB-dependent receptor [Phormidium sp. FACHB-592]